MITCAEENLEAAEDEVKTLLPEHWEELALNKDKVPLDPDYDFYYAREREGRVLFLAMRDDGRLIGYFIGFVGPGVHYRTCMTLTGDIFYLSPAYRHALYGLRLFREVEKAARSRGVHRIFLGSKMHKDVSVLFKRLAYREVERYWSKWIGE